MKKVTIMVGIAGAGKSTYVQEHLTKNDIWLSSDNIRRQKYPGSYNPAKNKKVFKEMEDRLLQFVREAKAGVLYYDATNVTLRGRKELYRLIKAENLEKPVQVEIVYVDVPVNVAIRQNSKRLLHERVPGNIIHAHKASLQPPEIGKDCDVIVHVEDSIEESTKNTHSVEEEWARSVERDPKVLLDELNPETQQWILETKKKHGVNVYREIHLSLWGERVHEYSFEENVNRFLEEVCPQHPNVEWDEDKIKEIFRNDYKHRGRIA